MLDRQLNLDYAREIGSAISVYHAISSDKKKPSDDSKYKPSDKPDSLSVLEAKVLKSKESDEDDDSDSNLDDLDDTLIEDPLEFFLRQQEFLDQEMLYNGKHDSPYDNPFAAITDPYENEDNDPEYQASKARSDTMDDQEAKETVEKMALESASGNVDFSSLNMRDRQRFNNWQLVNTALLLFYDKDSPVKTSNTNYGMMN